MKKIKQILILSILFLLLVSCVESNNFSKLNIENENITNTIKQIYDYEDNINIKTELYFEKNEINMYLNEKLNIKLFLDTNENNITTIYLPIIYNKDLFDLEWIINENNFDIVFKQEETRFGHNISLSNSKGGFIGNDYIIEFIIYPKKAGIGEIYINENNLNILDVFNNELKKIQRVSLNLNIINN